MTTTSEVCRGCRQADCEALDELPDSHEFAGVPLPTALSGGRLYRCRQCRLVFRAPVLSADDYSALYAQASAKVWAAKPRVLRTDQTLVKNFIESNRPAGAKVLDVGCYTGELLSSLPPRYQKFGIEKSDQAARICAEAGIQMVGDDLYSADGINERFDVIVAMDVVEHTLNPDRFFKSLLGLLSEGGIIVVTTGDADNPVWRKVKGAFWYCSYAEHISFISPAWLQLNASKNKFGIAHLQSFAHVRIGAARRAAHWLLIHLYGVLGWRAKASWTAHLSSDHLLAVIRRQPA